MSTKQLLSQLLRGVGLMRAIDGLRYQVMRLLMLPKNRAFTRQHPDVILPPDALMYEAFQIDYHRYYVNGQKTATWLLELLEPYALRDKPSILDWGCGPGRVIRHLPSLLPGSICHGTDYNPRSVRWCAEHLSGIDFKLNGLMPPLAYPDASFDLVYGISIFTHLSETAHLAWLDELIRVLRPGGILLLTLHGDSFKSKLNHHELSEFNRGALVVRGKVKEGHRTYTAFHPPTWVMNWAGSVELLSHQPGNVNEQDVWIFRKPSSQNQ